MRRARSRAMSSPASPEVGPQMPDEIKSRPEEVTCVKHIAPEPTGLLQATESEDEETHAAQEITAAMEPAMEPAMEQVMQTLSQADEAAVLAPAPVAEEESLASSRENSPEPKRRRIDDLLG